MATSRLGVGEQLVGRQAELNVAMEQIRAALSGTGRALLLSGEAGIGKTRLVVEIRARFLDLAPHGITMTGYSFEPDRGVPFAPLLDAVRSHPGYGRAEAVEGLIGHDVMAFVRLLPELQVHAPQTSPIGVPTPEEEKARLFRALLGLFERQVRDQPLLLVIEDLHWSDETSLEFLVHLTRAIRISPIMLVCTFRSEEEHPDLRRALVEISRLQVGVELPLGRLSIGNVDLLLRGFFNQPYSIRSDFLRAVYQLTEGNPLYVEEVVRSLIAAGDVYRTGDRWTRKELQHIRIPRSVRDALARRTEYLNATALEVLEIAAVVGQRIEFDLLERLTGLAEARLLETLRDLTEARLLVEEAADQFRFYHALIRASVYERLLARERRIRHGQVADALEDLHRDLPEPWLAELAYQFHAAERWEKALEYASEAGRRALALFSAHAAVEHFSRALEAHERLGRIPSAELLRQRGQAYEVLGEFDSARSDFDAALQNARTNGDLREEWDVLIALGRSWEGHDYAQAGSWFERGLALARQLGDPVVLAHTLNRLGNWYCNTEYVEEARAAHLEALAIFETLGDQPGIAATLDYLGILADIAGDLVEMRARCLQAIEMFDHLGDLQRLSSTLSTLACTRAGIVYDTVAVPVGTTYAESIAWAERALHLARDTGWRAGEAYALIILGMVDTGRANYGRAFPLAADALEIAGEIDHLEWLAAGHMVMGALFYEILAHQPAMENLERSRTLAHESGSRFFQHLTTGIFADSLIDRGELERVEAILSPFPHDMTMTTLGQRCIWSARANLALGYGSAAEALAILDRLIATGTNIVDQQDVPMLGWRRGRALAQLGLRTEAEGALLAARAGSIALGKPSWLWRIDLDLARLYQTLGTSEDAAQALRNGRAVVGRVGANIPDEHLRAGFLSGAAQLFDAIDGGSRARRSRARDTRLTPREADVARLVARGLSNRQIAHELSIGERTVETHVSNALGKLGFTSRAQLAAWVVEHDLARPAEGSPAVVLDH